MGASYDLDDFCGDVDTALYQYDDPVIDVVPDPEPAIYLSREVDNYAAGGQFIYNKLV
jgi:hypothetical protein